MEPYANKPKQTEYRRLLSHLPLREIPGKATLRKHATANWARIKLGDETFKKLYKFSFVRNPFDLVVSQYEYMKQKADHHRHATVACLSFSEFVDWHCNRFLKRKPEQCRFVLSFSGKMLVDDIYRFETIGADVSRLCGRLGIEPPKSLPHHNRTEHRPYQLYYTKKDRETVARTFARDIEHFQYSFDDSL